MKSNSDFLPIFNYFDVLFDIHEFHRVSLHKKNERERERERKRKKEKQREIGIQTFNRILL